MQTAVPEAMVITNGTNTIEAIHPEFSPTAQVLGMGMGTSDIAAKALRAYLENENKGIVLDADALNLMAKETQLLKLLPKDSILTPHPKELERLIGKWKDDFDKIEKALSFSKKHKCVLLIKGAHTMILHKGKGYINTTGNPGMATAGSGDVLSGIIGGLLAQGYDPWKPLFLVFTFMGRPPTLSYGKWDIRPFWPVISSTESGRRFWICSSARKLLRKTIAEGKNKLRIRASWP